MDNCSEYLKKYLDVADLLEPNKYEGACIEWDATESIRELVDRVKFLEEKMLKERNENIRLRVELDDPGMEGVEFRTLLDLLMYSDPWPTKTYEFDSVGLFAGEPALKQFANRKAQFMGFDNWVDAYHCFNSEGMDQSA
jgi:hypothetical protein